MKERSSYSYSGAGADDVPHYSSGRRSRRHHRDWERRRVNGDVRPMLLDTWALAETVLKRWYWMLLAAILCAGLAGFAGWNLWQPSYVGTAQLIRFQQQNSAEFFKYQEITQPTFLSILESPELLERISRKAKPGVSPEDLKHRLTIVPAHESDVVAIQIEAETAERAVSLANLYTTNAVEFFRELQSKEAAKDNEYLTNQLAKMDADIVELNKRFKQAPQADALKGSATPSPADKLKKANTELDELLARFTERHPDVIAKQNEVARLKREVQNWLDNQAAHAQSKNADTTPIDDIELLRAQVQMLVSSRIMLASRQREAEQFAKNSPGYCRVFAPAELNDAQFKDPKAKIAFLGVAGGIGGIGAVILLILFFELFDNRLKTAADLKRVTRLPVIAALGDIEKMHPSVQSSWGFRTWTALQSRLSASPNHGLVCGFTSSGPGQGRSTWIRLLAKAASQCGFRVLTVATLPSPPFTDSDQEQELKEEDHGSVNGNENEGVMKGTETSSPFGSDPCMAVANNVLSTPAQVTEKLTGDNPQPLVHIPLPGWVWSLERRKQWQSALKQWRNIENIVILVELPPACDPEAVLLAENIPNVIWLSDGTKADASESREQLQTLRDARCNLVGTVMNRAPAAARMRKRFSRWVGAWPLLAAICLAAHSARAEANDQATPAPPVIETNDLHRRALEVLHSTPVTNQPVTAIKKSEKTAPPIAGSNESPRGAANRAATKTASTGDLAVADDAPPKPAPAKPAAVPIPDPAATNGVAANVNREPVIFGTSVTNRADWQKRLTLGPGDTLNISMYGQTLSLTASARLDLNGNEVVIAPDGTVSYLQAIVMAEGLTVDELRTKLDEELGKFHRSPRTIVVPVSFKSKKYYVLGKVVNKGVYTLDRPVTLLEAVARAKGLETGLLENQNTYDLADMQRSFLVRRNQRVPVDLEKLFFEGDLTQNVALEPDDYLYFASANLKEVYVLGQVRRPGAVTYTANMTVIGAISQRDGYTDKAFKSRVLVVRGSLNNPKTFIVDTWATLDARGFNFKLEPKDIVYVSTRPFIRVEEVLDLAASAFIESATAAWAGKYIGPIIGTPFLPTP
jgi:protein involved in polysaccharide export with SLBB domain/capsular polysaccharide biosynthesis protein